MKRPVIAALMAVISAIAAFAAPEIVWLGYRHNFGAFDEDKGPVSCRFRFVNTGDEPLTVISTHASCGCTQPEYPRQSVAPGDTAEIVVTYNPEGRPGRFRKNVQVDTDAANMPKTKLTIEGVVIGSSASVAIQYPAAIGPLNFRQGGVSFGQVTKPHLKTVFVDAYNRNSDSIRPRVVSVPRYVDVNFEPRVVGPGERVTLICYLRTADAPLYGLVEDSLMLSTGGEPFAVPFSAIINEDFSSLTDAQLAKAPVAALDASVFDFGRLSRKDKSLTRTIKVTNTGREPLVIRRVYSPDRAIAVSVNHSTIKPGHSATVTATVDPATLTPPLLDATVILITNDPANPVQTLRAIAEVQ